MEEMFEIHDVKNEFLKNVGPQYQSMYAPQQLDIALYMLNDFCNNVAANQLVLFRQIPDQPQPQASQRPQGFPQQQAYPQQAPPQQFYPQEAQFSQPRVMPQPQFRQVPMQQPMQNPFSEYDEERFNVQQNIQQQVNEMNRGIRENPPMRVREPPVMPRPYEAPQPQPQMGIPTRGGDVDLRAEKPKSFVDKIKDMRTPKKADKINPEE